VDDGMYEIIDEGRFRIGSADVGVVFHYEVDGDTLRLTPEITKAMLEEALASPFEFSPAGWSVAVLYGGEKWNAFRAAAGARDVGNGQLSAA
jgi:hypothetical protein